MNWLKRVFGSAFAWLSQYVMTSRAKSDIAWALEHIPAALPVIDVAATILTAVTPPKWDDKAWAGIKVKYPALWDGTIKTADELKLYVLGIATELFVAKFPTIGTTRARIAVQQAYSEWKGLQEAK